jgi:copper oxidase (laccase) domain-containing protein
MKFNLSKQFKGFSIISSEVSDGPMNFDLPKGQKNIEKFLAINKIVKPLVTCSQQHKTKIAIAQKPERIFGADGVLTTKDLALGVKTADCVPLMLYEPASGLIGAIHVSRNNLLAGIISLSLKNSLRKLLSANSKPLAFLGPHIRVKNYPLKDEAIIKIKRTKYKKYLITIGDKTHFDLTKATISDLAEIGFLEENIKDSRIDTFNAKDFYSSRQNKGRDFGVFITVISKDEKKDLQE